MSRPNRAKWWYMRFIPWIISSRVSNGNAPSSTYKHWKISNVVSDLDLYIACVWLHTCPSSMASAFVVITFNTGIPFCFHTVSSDSANAFIMNKNSTGAMLSPWRTPTVCLISTLSFSILSTTILFSYIFCTADTNFGGAPYLSRTERSIS